jgi:osmotically-inducible protein OsmY
LDVVEVGAMNAWSAHTMKHQLISLLVLGLAGSTPRAMAAAASNRGAPSNQAAANDDASISDVVFNAILSDDIVRYDAASVRVSARGGVVTLSGTVPRNAIRQRMGSVARAVQGVSRVVNLLVVAPK